MRDIVEAVKQALPDASSKPPGEVLEYVRARLTEEGPFSGQLQPFNNPGPNSHATKGDEPK
jgi:hypothetical protein